MSKVRSFIKYWLPAILWMSLIFSASGDIQSFHRSSRIIRPVILWLFPNMPDEMVNAIVFVARKCAHLTEYAILAFLFWRALRKPVKTDPRAWSWRHAGFAILLVAIYAATDEWHQRYVPSRDGSVRDVLIDVSGATLGMLFLWRFHHWRERRREKKLGRSGQKETKETKLGI